MYGDFLKKYLQTSFKFYKYNIQIKYPSINETFIDFFHFILKYIKIKKLFNF